MHIEPQSAAPTTRSIAEAARRVGEGRPTTDAVTAHLQRSSNHARHSRSLVKIGTEALGDASKTVTLGNRAALSNV